MITLDGRFFARVVMGLAGVALLILGAFSYDADRITLRDVAGLVACVLVFTVAALWHRRESRQHGGRRRS